MMAMLIWITMRERRKFSMPEHLGTSEVEVGEEDGIVMVRVLGEEGLDGNPSRTNKELNKEPLRVLTYKVPLQQCKVVLHLAPPRFPTINNSKALARVLKPDGTIAMSSGILLHFVLIGEDSVQMLQINVRNVDSLRMTAFAIPAMRLRAIPTSPFQESIAVKEYLLIEELEGQVMALRVLHRLNLKWRAQ